jgi:hypothetical protein
MDADNRASPRVPVSIKMSCAVAADGSLHIYDLSLGGFMAGGKLSAKAGDPIEGTIHALPSAGDRDVSVRGRVARILPDGEALVIGVKIESFDSPEGEKAYRDFVRELYEDG